MRPVYLTLTLAITSILFSYSSSAQYYYKDIWSSQQLNKEFAILKAGRIRNVAIKSFEGDGQPSEGFFCEKRISKNYEETQMLSKSNVTGASLIISNYNPQGLIIKTIDSTENSFSQTEYEYNESGKITQIKTFTKDDDAPGGITEIHRYIYNGDRLVKMTREKNNSPLSTVNFTIDEKGNIADEEEITNGSRGKKFFYYYDDQNRLTDVVHYNERAKRLLPDYMYEYDEQGQIVKMVTTEEGASNYFTWIYTYNDKKLRQSERCSAKDKRLLGSVEYVYK